LSAAAIVAFAADGMAATAESGGTQNEVAAMAAEMAEAMRSSDGISAEAAAIAALMASAVKGGSELPPHAADANLVIHVPPKETAHGHQ
jgi:hypothetical protein